MIPGMRCGQGLTLLCREKWPSGTTKRAPTKPRTARSEIVSRRTTRPSIGETGTNTAAIGKGDSLRNVLQLWASRPLCTRMPKQRLSKKASSPCCPRRPSKIFLEDTVATVEETGFLYISLGHLTSNVQRAKKGTLLGTAVPVTMVQNATPQVMPVQETLPQQSSANCVYKIYEQMNFNSSSENSSSFKFEFLSSTDPSELGLSEREVKKRTDPVLMVLIPSPEAQLS